MDIKHFHISIEAGKYRGGLNALAIDDLLILKSPLGGRPETHILLSLNPEWAKLVGLIRGDVNPDTTTATVSLSEKEYETKFRKVTAPVLYWDTGVVRLYTNGEIVPRYTGID